MRNQLILAIGLLILLLSSGCATNFTGSAYVQGGAEGCTAKCQEQGMELAGMVFLGEYTSGCVCALPGHERTALDGAANVTGAAVGVVEQNRRSQQQQHQ